MFALRQVFDHSYFQNDNLNFVQFFRYVASDIFDRACEIRVAKCKKNMSEPTFEKE